MLDLLTLQGSSPRIQRCLQEEELCKTTLTCHFALDVVYMSIEWKRNEQCFLRKPNLGTLWTPASLLHDEAIYAASGVVSEVWRF